MFLELLNSGSTPASARAASPPKPPPERPAPLFQPAANAVAASSARVEAKPDPRFEPNPIPSVPTAEDLEERASTLQGWDSRIWIMIAAGVVLAVLVWGVAYSSGKAKAREDAEREKYELMKRYSQPTRDPLEPTNRPEGSGSAAAPATGTNTTGAPPPKPGPTAQPPKPEVPSATQSGSLQKGSNYLVVATLMKKDALEAAEYLSTNKLQITLVSTGKPVELTSPEANNVMWMVVVLKGYTSADFRKLDSERMALVTQVQSLGRKWKAENKKAPTDFAQVFWWKFKGND